MEYLSGKTLKEIIREEGPMPLPRVVEIFGRLVARSMRRTAKASSIAI